MEYISYFPQYNRKIVVVIYIRTQIKSGMYIGLDVALLKYERKWKGVFFS